MIMSTNESQHELTTPLGNIVEQEERTKEWHITSLCRLCQLLLMSHSEIMFYSEEKFFLIRPWEKFFLGLDCLSSF